MALKNADFCIACKEHRTKHPSKLCYLCRTGATAQMTCLRCKAKTTTHESGLCVECRRETSREALRNKDDDNMVDKTIETLREDLYIIMQRRLDVSFKSIAEHLGITAEEAAGRYTRRIQKRIKGTMDNVDGSYIFSPIEHELASRGLKEAENKPVQVKTDEN